MDMTKEIMDFTIKMEQCQTETLDYDLKQQQQQQQQNTITDEHASSEPTAFEDTEHQQQTATVEPIMVKPIQELTALAVASNNNNTEANANSASLANNNNNNNNNNTGTTHSTAAGSDSTTQQSSVNELPPPPPQVSAAPHSLRIAGNLTPPPRPLTSSELLSIMEPDPEIQIELSQKKSRSLPVSPNPLIGTAPAAMPHLATLFSAQFATRHHRLTPPPPSSHQDSASNPRFMLHYPK